MLQNIMHVRKPNFV